MLVNRQSVLTQKWHTMDLPIKQEQIDAWKGGELVQHAFPDLTPAQRQFIISGVTEEEWEKAFGDEDNINPDDLVKIAGASAKKTLIIVQAPDDISNISITPPKDTP